MVIAQPEFRQVGKPVICGDLVRREVVMVIDDGLGRGVIVVEVRAASDWRRKSGEINDIGRIADC